MHCFQKLSNPQEIPYLKKNLFLFLAIAAEKKHEDFKAGIEGFQKDKLSKAETVEKNTLPTKEVIEQEKTA